MANQKILDRKQCVIDEVSEKVKNSSSLVIFEYQGLTVKETDELRKLLKNADSEFKVYKNTLVNRALKSMDIDFLVPPFGKGAMSTQSGARGKIATLPRG